MEWGVRPSGGEKGSPPAPTGAFGALTESLGAPETLPKGQHLLGQTGLLAGRGTRIFHVNEPHGVSTPQAPLAAPRVPASAPATATAPLPGLCKAPASSARLAQVLQNYAPRLLSTGGSGTHQNCWPPLVCERSNSHSGMWLSAGLIFKTVMVKFRTLVIEEM